MSQHCPGSSLETVMPNYDRLPSIPRSYLFAGAGSTGAEDDVMLGVDCTAVGTGVVGTGVDFAPGCACISARSGVCFRGKFSENSKNRRVRPCGPAPATLISINSGRSRTRELFCKLRRNSDTRSLDAAQP